MRRATERFLLIVALVLAVLFSPWFAFATEPDDPPPIVERLTTLPAVYDPDPPPIIEEECIELTVGLGTITLAMYDAPARAPSPAQVVATLAAIEALDEVNALRWRRGLRPFMRDAALTQAAQACAAARAASGLFGHLPSDYAYLPPGARAAATGCAAYAGNNWLTCCTDENWSFAGAAWAPGSDGKRYMHLFVSNTPNPDPPVIVSGPVLAADCAAGSCAGMAAPQAYVSASGVIVRQTSVATFAAPQSAPAIRTPVRSIGRAVVNRLREGGPVRRILRATSGILAGGCG